DDRWRGARVEAPLSRSVPTGCQVVVPSSYRDRLAGGVGQIRGEGGGSCQNPRIAASNQNELPRQAVVVRIILLLLATNLSLTCPASALTNQFCQELPHRNRRIRLAGHHRPRIHLR